MRPDGSILLVDTSKAAGWRSLNRLNAGSVGSETLAAVFPDPDRLDLRRDARSHLAFGFGVHQCLGQPLARLELQVVYHTLLRRAPNLALAAELDRIPFKHDGFVYGLHELPVTW